MIYIEEIIGGMSAEAEKGDVAVQESGKRELELAGEAGKPDEVNEENTSAKKVILTSFRSSDLPCC